MEAGDELDEESAPAMDEVIARAARRSLFRVC